MADITADRNFTMKLAQALRAQQAGITVFFFSLEHWSFHYRISGQCFDPYCSS